ncbi:hypothetical protein B0H14DRAFT_2563388 [Mycena olivaceomarginata]|nr:hypothetical protein B0H14DRAFT_2563388 [Mycena olivaceomarginata]
MDVSGKIPQHIRMNILVQKINKLRIIELWLGRARSFLTTPGSSTYLGEVLVNSDIYPDSRSLAHHACVPIAVQPWGLRRLRPALLERGSQLESGGVVKRWRERRSLEYAQSHPRARTTAEPDPAKSDNDGKTDERESGL